jgi:K+-transporting ATPase ATPase C chain
MNFANLLRQHAAALRALLVLTVILGIGYPVFIWLVAQIPGLRDNADGSLIEANGKLVGSSLIGQSFTDADGNPLPRYFQSRPSMAGDGYDPMSTGASNLGPESVVDQPDKPSLLTLVCSRSAAVGTLDGVDGARPFCTGGGVGAVLSVIGPRDARGNVVHPTKVVSINEPCDTTKVPFLNSYEGVRVECAKAGENYSLGQIVPIRGSAPAEPAVPADAVTASGSGLDPNISVAYADLQVDRVAKARGLNSDLVRAVVAQHTAGRTLGFLGEPRVNVLELNIALDAL